MKTTEFYKKVFSFITFSALLFLVFVIYDINSSASENTYVTGNYSLNYTLIRNSSLTSTDSGYCRVINTDDGIFVENYDDSLKLLSKKTIEKELDIYGGFFSGKDAYYLVFGQNNKEEDDNKEVIRVVKYDKDWKRLSSASLHGDSEFAHDIRYPFDAGNVSFDEINGILYLCTGHEGYVDEYYGQGHQGYLMFAINESDMSWKIIDADLWHSFSQYISIMDENHIFVAEESEGSECTKITKYSLSSTDSDESSYDAASIPVFKYGGTATSAWAIATYASVDGVSYSAENVLVIGTSIDQSRYYDTTYSKNYNIYLTVTPINNFTEDATQVVWLTDIDVTDGFKAVKLTKINNDRFLVSWETDSEETSIGSEDEMDSLNTHVLHYIFINGNGEKISEEFKAAAAISDCDPIVKNGKVIFYASDNAVVAFYTIDTSTGKFSKKLYNTIGVSGSWSYSNGVITIFGSGAINGTKTWYGGESPFKELSDKITKIVIGDGITSIGDYTFNGLENVETVVFGKGVKSIGANAFSYCESLGDIYLPSGLVSIGEEAFYGRRPANSRTFIPKSVTTIGKDAFSSNWYPIGDYSSHICWTTIYCENKSTAHKYAVSNSINYVLAAITIKDKTADANGKPISIAKASLTATQGKVSYTYYTDKKCTLKTSSSNGAKSDGGAPANPGTYYVKAAAAEYKSFGVVNSNIAVLTIKSTSKYPFSSDKITKADLSKNQIITDITTNGKYKITSVKKKNGIVISGTVSYLAPKIKKVSSVTIGNTVKIGGVKFNITEIYAKALYKNTYVKKLTIGKNITAIGKYAFSGCSNLTSIMIKTSSLTANSFGKKSFYNIGSKVTVKVPKAKYNAYLTYIKKAGLTGKKQKVLGIKL